MVLTPKISVPFTQGCSEPSLVGSGEEIFKFRHVILLFCYHLPLEKSVPLNLNKIESPSPKDVLCHVWLKFAQCSGEEDEI